VVSFLAFCSVVIHSISIQSFAICIDSMPMDVSSKDSIKCLFELLVGHGIAKWIDWRVSITKKVCKVEQVVVNTAFFVPAKAFNESNNVVGCPADDKGS